MKMYTWSQQVLPAELLFWDICKGPIQAPFLETVGIFYLCLVYYYHEKAKDLMELTSALTISKYHRPEVIPLIYCNPAKSLQL